jgi:hypothetical protein
MKRRNIMKFWWRIPLNYVFFEGREMSERIILKWTLDKQTLRVEG